MFYTKRKMLKKSMIELAENKPKLSTVKWIKKVRSKVSSIKDTEKIKS